MGSGDVHPLRAWREAQQPRMTLDAAAAGVGTVRQTWYDWETGRRIPDRTYMPRIYGFTQGVVRPDHFYELPPIGQMALPFETGPAPLLDLANGENDEPQLQAAA
jgi:hypothetical protein